MLAIHRGNVARILVIEDINAVRSLVERMLRQAGHHVFLASDGTTGLRLSRSQELDLVIVDIGLPGKTGVETVLELRTLQPALPVIIISGRGHEELLDLITGAGLLDTVRILSKPFELEELVRVVQEALESPSARNEGSSE